MFKPFAASLFLLLCMLMVLKNAFTQIIFLFEKLDYTLCDVSYTNLISTKLFKNTRGKIELSHILIFNMI